MFLCYFGEDAPAKRKKPKISIIVVGKRHHIRFYPVEQEDADGAGT